MFFDYVGYEKSNTAGIATNIILMKTETLVDG